MEHEHGKRHACDEPADYGHISRDIELDGVPAFGADIALDAAQVVIAARARLVAIGKKLNHHRGVGRAGRLWIRFHGPSVTGGEQPRNRIPLRLWRSSHRGTERA